MVKNSIHSALIGIPDAVVIQQISALIMFKTPIEVTLDGVEKEALNKRISIACKVGMEAFIQHYD